MPGIAFDRDQKAAIVQRIRLYFDQELHQQIGGFDAEFLLDFFTDQIGAYYYNRGLHDAQAILAEKLEDVADAIFQLEQPTEFSK